MKLKEIAEGWKNVLIEDLEVEKIADDRKAVCDSCNEKISLLGIGCCGMCHCPLLAKQRSVESSCPLNKWS